MDEEPPSATGDIAILDSENTKNHKIDSSATIFLNNPFNTFNQLNNTKTDLEGILLRPDTEKGEIAVLNPSIYQENQEGPWPFIYRTELPNNKGGRYSVIDLRWLSKNEQGLPIQLSDKKRIIFPEYEYEQKGCEDPRLTKVKDTYYITYVAFDGINARTALATTKDFKTITKQGIITPQIPLKQATEITEDDIYKKSWKEHYQKTIEHFNNLGKPINPDEIYPYDKDANFDFNEELGMWELTHRLEPNIQIARAKNWKEFQNQNYWKNHLKNINIYTLLQNTMPWASEKIGFNCYFKLGDKKVGLYHGVDKEYNYRNSFFEIKNGKIQSILTNPLIEPDEQDKFEYTDDKGKIHSKNVLFSTATLLLDKLWIYSGSGDQRINYYTTEIDWLYAELNHPSNIIKN